MASWIRLSDANYRLSREMNAPSNICFFGALMDTQQLLEAAKTIEILQALFADDKNQCLPVIAA